MIPFGLRTIGRQTSHRSFRFIGFSCFAFLGFAPLSPPLAQPERRRHLVAHNKREREATIKMVRCSLLLTLAALAIPTSAFAPPSRTAPDVVVRSKSTTELFLGDTKLAPSLPEVKDISYGEESRQYRRTVFSHDDWVRFRNPDRFWYYIFSLFSSGIYKSIGREVLTTTGIATFIVIFNCLVGGYADFEGVKHDALITSQWLPLLGLPLAPFTLSSPSLGLLLGTLVGSCWTRRSRSIRPRADTFASCFLSVCKSFAPIPATDVGTKRVRTGA